ncbi:GGDEF domain-containing protein [Marinobacterium sp. AK62]|uniref:diguanylate cyclase n=1 Tax=Marinobacterium alkalitolerans TaxID=1542925 RepID=A0ABS3ZDS4_9GAMM|nr:GGDEF domain-containing protein [Marinobacterium alkalitolerans]MBP0049853.1 GGDEF domain-containing protein [Marinobacterium alkalitolerans]
MFGKKDDWQSKYKALVRETERHEKQLSGVFVHLRSLAIQLNLATHGQSPKLDALLDQLKSELDAGKLDSVQELLRKTEKHVRRLEGTRGQLVDSLLKQFRDWSGLLLLQDRDGACGGTLGDVRQRLEEPDTDLSLLPDIASTLLGVQKKLSHVAVAKDADDDVSKINDVVTARLAARMLELLKQINVPSRHAARAHGLMHRLEVDPDAQTLEACLEDLSGLMRACGGNLEADIQDYLVNLNQQLAYLRSFVDTSDELEQKQRKRNNLLDQTVRQDVSRIHTTVENTHDINELKLSVNAQLDSIIQAMNTHKASEDEHLATLKKEKSALIERVSQMEQKAESFRKQAEDAHVESRTDPLTGLPNRLAFDQKFDEELKRFQRYGTPFSLCVGDLDKFKSINDQYGHLAGDKVLRLTAKVLRNHLREVDFIARFGGEEFVILLPSTTAEEAKQAAEKIRQAVEKSPFNFQGQPVQVTISIGGAEVRQDDTSESLFERADKSMYEAKQAGRNRVLMDE